jgi:hypothetical protein
LFSGTLVEVLPERLLTRTSISYAMHRKRILYILDNLSKVGEMKPPVFVFAHVLAPHPPFVFGEHGEPIESGRNYSLADGSEFMSQGNKSEYLMNYIRQLMFVNSRMKETIDDILSSSPEPPIIILQADHGPGSMLDWEKHTNFEERMSILNAFYLPMDGHRELYQEITPVNSFRVILDYYFGTDLDLLDDRSYFSSIYYPYEFMGVFPEEDIH